jgi:hypothetical protein
MIIYGCKEEIPYNYNFKMGDVKFMKERGLHLINQPIKKVISSIPLISYQGFTWVQISNLCPTKSEEGQWHEWWKLYQSKDFSLGNYLGSKEDLKELCRVAKSYNIKIAYDIVLRHTANGDWGDSKQPNTQVPEELRNNKECWLPKMDMNHYDRYSTTHHCNDLPSLNYDNEIVRKHYSKLIDELGECGVDMLRVDMAKHFALPSEGSDFWLFLNNKAKEYGMTIYGEMIQCGQDLMTQYIVETGMDVLIDDRAFWDKNKSVVMAYSHDHCWTWNCHCDDESVIRGWEDVCKNNPKTLFFSEDYSRNKSGMLWADERIREINLRTR